MSTIKASLDMSIVPLLKPPYEELNVFFQEELYIKDYAKAIVDLIEFKRNFDICLDRSNWKFGDKDINYLVLSWRINKKISLPLLFVDLNKAGNSNTAERLDLLKAFNEVFGFHRIIKSLIADREFVGKKWFELLNKNKVPYFIRVKENTLLPWGKDNPIKAKILFQHLKWGENRLINVWTFCLFCWNSQQNGTARYCDK